MTERVRVRGSWLGLQVWRATHRWPRLMHPALWLVHRLWLRYSILQDDGTWRHV